MGKKKDVRRHNVTMLNHNPYGELKEEPDMSELDIKEENLENDLDNLTEIEGYIKGLFNMADRHEFQITKAHRTMILRMVSRLDNAIHHSLIKVREDKDGKD